jgi:hypothetical protein
MSMPTWSRHFDRAYCFHFVGNAARLPSCKDEFRRVGLLDSGILRWARTFPDPWEVKLLDAVPSIAVSRNRATAVAFLNLGLASCRVMREAIADGCERVLFLEDDIRFLRDTGMIADYLGAIPDGYDIVQFDKFAPWELTPEQYAEDISAHAVNERYFDTGKTFWASGGCFMATARGMANMLKGMEEWRPGPMDGYLNMNGNRHAASKLNLAVQVMMGDAMCMQYMGKRNTHHLAYRPQGVKYEDYAVPDGYGYDALCAKC